MDTRTPAEKEDAARRDAELVRRRREGQTFEQIGSDMGFSKQYAAKRFYEVLKEIPAQEVDAYRQEQEDRLDWLLREARAVLGRDHVLVSHGSVVREGEPEIDEETGEAVIREGAGAPMLDDGPKLQAIDMILKIETRRAKLLGLDAPVKTEMTGSGLRVELVGVDPHQAMT